MSRRSLRRAAPLWAPVLVALGLLGAACGSNGDTSNRAAGKTATTAATQLSGDITVLAAASLTDSFTEIGKAFEAANPGIHVKFSFDSSSTLAGQANNGAPADVFASADEPNMKKAVDGGSALDPKPFTRNDLAIIVGK